MPSPAKDGTSAVPTLLPPSSLYPPPSSPSGHRTLRKLQSAHNLGAKANSSTSMISQQRLLQQQQLHYHHQQQAQQQLQSIQAQQQRSSSPVRRNISNISNTATLGTGVLGSGTMGSMGPPSNTNASNTGSTRSPQRGRANSDAMSIQQIGAAASANASRRPLLGRSPALDALSIDRLVRDGPPDGDVVGALNNLRWKILETGIKSDSDGMSSARIYVWLILLDCPVLETDAYLSLIHRGASPAYSKIRNDTFRTLTTDPLFRRRVSEASLIRLLNAIAWKLHDVREEKNLKHPPMLPSNTTRQSLSSTQQQESGGKGVLSMLNNAAAAGSTSANTSPAAKNRARALTLTTEGSETSTAAEPGTYVQGMNVLAAPFLYAARSEAEAFVAFHHLLTKECPGYIRGAMDGVHKGLALVDKVLAIVDSKLSLYLLSKNLSAEIYAFPSVLTLCACTPPLPEVLRLWDFLFAYGPHLNILCIVAQLMMIRNQILTSPSPNKLLRSFPALQADSIKRVTLTIIRKLPADVYAEIVNHAL